MILSSLFEMITLFPIAYTKIWVPYQKNLIQLPVLGNLKFI